jgi:hypothetical protein
MLCSHSSVVQDSSLVVYCEYISMVPNLIRPGSARLNSYAIDILFRSTHPYFLLLDLSGVVHELIFFCDHVVPTLVGDLTGTLMQNRNIPENI